jgi:ferredoxin
MTVHVVVDENSCIGSAECVALDPEAIELDEDGTARMRIAELDEERARRLCDTCPTAALSISS